MTVKIIDFQVSFDSNGNLNRNDHDSGFKQKNSIFNDTLEYIGYLKARPGGNSYLQFISIFSGRKYHMFISDFNDVILAKRFVDNKVFGNFYFVRKGNSQGIKLIL